MTRSRKNYHFSAVLTPNRSLSQKGFVVLMSLIAVISFIAGIVFVSIGAWPVFGFFGLDVVLLYWAFRRNYVDNDVRELIEVSEYELVVTRFIKDTKVREQHFLRSWVRVDLAEDKVRELVGSFTIHCHGQTTEIAAFLGPDERQEFFKALQRALIA